MAKQTVFTRALEFIADGHIVGLGTGRAATLFIKLLAERVRQGLKIHAVPTSTSSEELARSLGVKLVTLEQAFEGRDDDRPIDVTVDGADEFDPSLNLIKGYGRALVREKIVAAASRELVILAGPGKAVRRLGERGNLPVEVVPFAMPLCCRKLSALGCEPVPFQEGDRLFLTDNGNNIVDCKLSPPDCPASLERDVMAIPGVVGTGLFLGLATAVLEGDVNFCMIKEHRRPPADNTTRP